MRIYLKGKGAEISEENTPEGLVKDLKQVIEASTIIWKDDSVKDAGIKKINFQISFKHILSVNLTVDFHLFECT